MLFLVSLILVSLLVAWILIERWRHERHILRIPHRIHVNGIRGKSTVTRILAGMLREAGYTTVAKATGSAAMVIDRDGDDHELVRKGAPSILEQLDVVRRWTNRETDALVVECMALKPQYQRVSELSIVHSTIGVITNIREDHQDVMGETLPEIARSLAQTCPLNGVLITAEQEPELIEVLRQVSDSRGTRLVVANPQDVTDAELDQFDYVAFKDNVAVGLEVAKVLGISREVAFAGMSRAAPDPGALQVREMRIAGKHVIWANLFAVNDRESMVVALERLAEYQTPSTTMVGILNNRRDRERRAIQFADVAVHDLHFDYLATFGAWEDAVTRRLRANGFDPGRVLSLGESRDPNIERIVQELISDMPTERVLLVGFVNIHTPQAELLMHYFGEVSEAQLVPTAGRSQETARSRPAAGTHSHQHGQAGASGSGRHASHGKHALSAHAAAAASRERRQ